MNAQVVVLEITGRSEKLGRDHRGKPRQHCFPERLHDAVPQAGTLALPVDARLQVGNGTEHIEAVASGGREAWIRGRGTVQVEGEILGEELTVEDVRE